MNDVIPNTMRAAVLGAPGQIYVATKPVPNVGPDEVLIRVHRASLCGTDLKIRSREFFKDGGPPDGEFTPGHEYAGVVAAVGHTVDEFRIGDRVVTEAHRGCMRCLNCLNGRYTDCLNYGEVSKGHRTLGMTVDGGFAEYVVNHVSTLHTLPQDVDFDAAVALTTVGTVMHAVDVLKETLAGATVAVIGPGPIGLLMAQVARELGAGLVALTGTRPSRLELGEAYGADTVVNATTEDPVVRVSQATGGRGVDVVFECSGAPVAVDQALGMVRKGGSVVLVGFFGEPVTVDLNEAVMNGVTIHSVRGEGSRSVSRAVSLASRGRLKTAPLITHRFPLEEIEVAFDTYQERKGGAIKVMLDIA